MSFTDRTISVAYDRQIRKRHCGADCACCGKNLYPSIGEPIPIVPKSKGGNWKASNCAILCRECFDELGGFEHPDAIPLNRLPYCHI